ncbi:4Fe-4S binding protein [Salidesulfovibrio onnuriiensis]|uniref:4Fe-4S binding protein n=1 Tax=Salidesulfovibrio onnuriiensis TaxID=2583823 RepID=UPI00202B89A1|nr:4Fe-4S binding protein [Salidesulfovibrio onnuriiensis]
MVRKKNRRKALKEVTLLLASSLLPVNISEAAQSDKRVILKNTLKKIATYQGKVDIEAADNKVFVFLDSDQFTDKALAGMDIMVFLQTRSNPKPWPDRTLYNAIISMTEDRVLIVSHTNRVVIGLYLSSAKHIIREDHFPGYEFITYSGFGLIRSIQPTTQTTSKVAQQTKTRSAYCLIGGPGTKHCEMGFGGCVATCSGHYYACCNYFHCHCVAGPYIDQSVCTGCGACEGICPVSAISPNGSTYVIDAGTCISCGSCKSECSVNAIIIS